MIIGHQKQWQFLKKSLELNRIFHSYLFSGLSSLGKKTLALEFIKLINCGSRQEGPCNKCNSCRMIDKKIHPDLFIISPSGTGQEPSIKISQIRKLQHFLRLRPYYGNLKSVILDESERMTKEAQSCLLKSLEEPKERNLLFLISDFADQLLPTIRSRCQTVKFFPVSLLEIENYLLKQGLSEKKSEFLASISYGKPGRIIEFLSHPQELDKENKVLKEILKVYNADLATRLQYVKNLTLTKEKARGVLEILQRYLRSILISGKGPTVKIKQNIKNGYLNFKDELIIIKK